MESYYECFLQIEKENDLLKANLKQMCEKLTTYDNRNSDNQSNKKIETTNSTINNESDKVLTTIIK